jgi:hypothetical protein
MPDMQAAPPNAGELIARHGSQAHQIVIDEIVRAVSRDDDAAAHEWDALLRAVERELEKANASPVSTAPYRVR